VASDTCALHVVKNWNPATTVIFYGKDGDLTSPDREHAETSMHALHLLQSALVHVNTCSHRPCWRPRRSATGWAPMRRGLSPLFWTRINPHRRFRLDMNTRLDLTASGGGRPAEPNELVARPAPVPAAPVVRAP
jgi:hypothetical protein